MKALSRIKRITTGKLELFLSNSEKPEVIFPQLIVEMEEQVSRSIEAEAKALSSVKRAELELEKITSTLSTRSSGAELAIEHNNEELAKEVIESQLALESKQILAEASLESAKDAYTQAKAVRVETQEQLERIRSKKDEILTRARILKTQQAMHQHARGPAVSTGGILQAVEAIETRLQEQEASIEVEREMTPSSSSGSSLDRTLEEMHRADEVHRRLEELKATVKKGESHATA